MEAIQINITLGLSPDALTAIKTLGGLFKGKVTVENETTAAPAVTDAKPAAPAQATKAPETAKPAPVAAAKAETVKITDPMLREAVAAAKTRACAQDVRDIFAEFGIRTSVDCPEERRQELLDRLNSLAA